MEKNLKAIDFHVHAFPDGLAEKALNTLHENAEGYRPHHDGTIGGLLKSMDRAGIEKSVVASIATRPDQVPKIVEWSIEVQSVRIVPFPSIHPDYRDFASELKKIAGAGLMGIKLHPMYQEFTIDDPALFPLYEAIAANGLSILFHAGRDIAFPDNNQADPDRIARVFEKFPGLRIVASHLGGWRTWQGAIDHLVGKPIYLETSFAVTDAPPELFRRIMEDHPRDYFLFGTDSPWLDQKKELDAWKGLDIEDEFKEKILYRNAEKLLGA